MNTEHDNAASCDTARVAAVLQAEEEVVMLAKPRTAVDAVEMFSRLVPGVAVLGFVGYVISQMPAVWYIVLLMLLPFVVLGVVSLSFPWRYKRRMERTVYVLTNRRVLVLEPGMLFGERMVAYPLQPNPVKKVHKKKDGSGDIVFAYEQRWKWHTRGSFRAPSPVGFLAVPQVEQVAQMIAEQVAATPAGLPALPAVPPALGPLSTETDSWGNPVPQQPGRGALIGFGAVFSLFSLVFALLGVYLMRSEARFEAEGIKATATVVKVNAHRRTSSGSRHRSGSGITIRVGGSRKSRDSYSYYPVLQFTDAQGRVHVYESDTGSTEYNFPLGHQLPITYLPHEPSEFRIDGEDNHIGIIFTIAGGFMFLVGGAILAGGIMKKK